MSEVVRLTLVSHAMTDAMSAGRFPTDEPLNSVGHRQADASIDLGITDGAFCGPEKRTRQTAELLGLQAIIDQRLADLECGRWRGDVLGGVRPADLAIWLTDPTRAPHGGESVVDLINRVRGWMDTLTTQRSWWRSTLRRSRSGAWILHRSAEPYCISVVMPGRCGPRSESGHRHQVEGLVHD